MTQRDGPWPCSICGTCWGDIPGLQLSPGLAPPPTWLSALMQLCPLPAQAPHVAGHLWGPCPAQQWVPSHTKSSQKPSGYPLSPQVVWDTGGRMCHLVAPAVEGSRAGTRAGPGSPCPVLLRQLHPWAPLCTIPTARRDCPGAGVHLAAPARGTHCLPQWTPGSLGWQLPSWESQGSAAEAAGTMIPG